MLNSIQPFVTEHWAAIGFALAYLFIGFVNALPTPGDPRPISQKIYDTFYILMHSLANKAIERRPQLAPATQIGGTQQTINVQSLKG